MREIHAVFKDGKLVEQTEIIPDTTVPAEHFLLRFTDTELAAIEDCTDLRVRKFKLRLLSRDTVDTDSDDVKQAMQLLTALGLVTESRSIEIIGT